MRLAMAEAVASRRAWAGVRALPEHDERQAVPERRLELAAPQRDPESGEALRRELAPSLPAASEEAAASCRVRPGSAISAMERARMPMGVRGDVVARYIDAFSRAGQDEVAGLLERLRKDKKVRVAELQIIAADLLEEEPAVRKKADHLNALRRNFLGSMERPQPRPALAHALHAD